ncbi:MAG: ABC transporter permease [Proteobacteria bacterium]|nr:ABC transporter permease [Pseudomonadota bacterium]
MPSLSLSYSKDQTFLIPKGEWCIWDLGKSYQTLQNIDLKNGKSRHVIIDLSEILKIDTGGATFLLLIKKRLEDQKFFVTFKNGAKEILQIINLVHHYPLTLDTPKKQSSFFFFISKLGEATLNLYSLSLQLISFFGQVILTLIQSLKTRSSFRLTSFCSHLQDVGVNALPIIGLISFLIGVVLAYQGITQLKRFGAEIFTVNLLALGILREVGILITAIVVAGRSGSAFTAQIGTMVLNEEVDAMQTMGLNPVNVLVIPRIMALMIALPLLTFFSDIIGLLGGAFMTHTLMDLSYVQFIEQLKLAIVPKTFWVGMIKSPFFAFLIGLVGCFEGLKVSGSAESIGQHTTKSVVEAIFLVIVADAGFSVLFSYLGI